MVPLATWTPGEIGIQHMAGARFARFLADKGVPVPEEWYVVADHPRRGLVVRTYDAPEAEVLRWLVRAATVACPIEIDRPLASRRPHPLTPPLATSLAHLATSVRSPFLGPFAPRFGWGGCSEWRGQAVRAVVAVATAQR